MIGPAFDRKTDKNIQWIPAKNLSVVWVQAQRPFVLKNAKNIADNFDKDMFGTLAVTLPNGQGIYHVIEGQHRRAAIEIKFGPDELVPCEVLPAVDPARAAELFDGINTRRFRVTSISTFKVRLTAGFQTEIDVDKIARVAGYRIEEGRKEKCISCVGALREIYTRNGPKILADTLKIIPATWGMDPNAVVADIVRGYGAFLLQYGGKANWQRLTEVIQKKFTPGQLVAAAKTRKETDGGTVPEAITAILRQVYNRGAKKTLV